MHSERLAQGVIWAWKDEKNLFLSNLVTTSVLTYARAVWPRESTFEAEAATDQRNEHPMFFHRHKRGLGCRSNRGAHREIHRFASPTPVNVLMIVTGKRARQ
jgi:hypothetical protein